VIEALSVQYAIKQCCEALRVSRSGFYQRQKAAESRRAAQEAELVKEIKSIYQANKGRYGSPRVSQTLRANGKHCGKNRVARLMRKEGLRARRKRAFRPRTTVAGKLPAPNW
jgi:putative transposase